MHVIRRNRIEELPDDDPDGYDYELTSPSRLVGTHINSIPGQSNVQSARLFYGGRFTNQALAVEGGEAPLVQNLDPEDAQGRSFDDILGDRLGIQRARRGGVVRAVDKDRIQVAYDDGENDDVDLYDDFVFNQKSGIASRPLVKPGDRIEPNQLLSASSYTDDNGAQAMGLNARIGLVPWKGFSMDDAVPISQAFASRLRAIRYKTIKQDADDNLKVGLNHFVAHFPTKFGKETLGNIDEHGMVRPGTILQPGDPILLATMPRTVSSAGVNVGRLSKAYRANRRDASQVWDGDVPAKVVRAAKTKHGYKIAIKYVRPTKEGDKITLRPGAKATVSMVIPDDRMPRTEDGEPLDLLLNPLSLNSRANVATLNELRLGNVAKRLGKPLKLPSFLPKGEDWNTFVAKLENENGVSSQARIWDPDANRFLTDPVTVGYGFVQKLHHTSDSKLSFRGTGSYDQNMQPARGGGDNAQAKRFSGLENYAAMSGGAYALMREHATIRGTKSDEFWHALRSGKPLPKPGVPFVWNKFRALLSGAGINTKDVGKGVFRLAPMTDKDLDKEDPVDIDNGDLVNLTTLESVPGGLFDHRIVTGSKWGRIKLPRPVLNPAMEEAARVMLGLTRKELEEIMAGRAELPPKLVVQLGLAARDDG